MFAHLGLPSCSLLDPAGLYDFVFKIFDVSTDFTVQ